MGPSLTNLLKDSESLKTGMRGEVLLPGEEGYDMARSIFNAMIDHRPALIARCADATDVALAVKYAHAHQLTVSVLGGGHGVSGLAVCDGGLMIDLSRMKETTVDPDRQIARAQGGATWGDFDHATQPFGLATTGGLVRSTGIAGLTLSGGYGFLMRKHGLSCDNLLSAEVVTADGRSLTASADQNPDLLWGLRGGGGNFGIVTSMEFRLHPVGTVYGGLVVFPIDQAKNLIRYYDDFVAVAPDELGPLLVLGTLPDGTKAVILLVCYAGSASDGARCLEPLLNKCGTPLMNQLAEMPYEAVQSIVENFNPRGKRNYWKSTYLSGVTEEAADVMLQRFLAAPSPFSHVVLYTLGGAMAHIGEQSTAVENRSAHHVMLLVGMWDASDDDDKNKAWVRQLFTAMKPHSCDGVYGNFDYDSGLERVGLPRGAATFERLQALKDKYDPTNFFRLNQNIRPSQT